MPWRRHTTKDSTFYRLKGSKNVYRETIDLSLDELNDSERDFEASYNPKFMIETVKSGDSIDFLPKGIYKIEGRYAHNMRAVSWAGPKDLKLFELDVVRDVLKDFEEFQVQENIYLQVGGKSAYRRGVLLYGPPGTGKTSAINMIVDSLKNKDIVLFYISDSIPSEFIENLKNDNRLKIFIFEELTQTIRENIGFFLTFLDGENSLYNSYTIATTNYPEQLPGNIVNRPGRFDKLFRIDKIPEKDRKIYLEHFLKRSISEQELTSTTKYSMAFLRELVLMILKNRYSFDDAITALDKHKQTVKNEFKSEVREIGFIRDEDD